MAGIDPALVLAPQHRMARYQIAVFEYPDLGRVVLNLDDPSPRRVGDPCILSPDIATSVAL
jgi:hypothetical protein